MTQAPTSGVLVFDSAAKLRQVDPAAARLLDADRTALLEGTIPALHSSVITPDGTTYPSLPSFVADLLEDPESRRSCSLGDTATVDARVTHDADGTPGVVVTVRNEPSPLRSSGSSSVSTRSAPEQVREQTHHLLGRMAKGAPLSDVLADLLSILEDACPSLRGVVLRADPSANTLHPEAAPSLPEDYVATLDGHPIGPSVCTPGRAAYHTETVTTVDLETDDCGPHDEALEHGLRACWATPILGEDDEVLGVFALYYDTPRRPCAPERIAVDEASRLASIAIEHDQKRRALQLQKDQLQRLVENAQPLIFFIDTDGTFLLSEGRDLSAVGLEPGEVVGQSVYDLYADYPTLLDYIDRALDGEQVDAYLEFDGVIFDIWYAPYYDHDGNVAGCMGMAVDVTERREAERALRKKKEWLQSITENTSGGLYRSTEERLVYANQALLDLFGYESLEAMKAADPTDFYKHPEVRDELIRRELEEGGVDGVEVEYRRKDGSTFTGLLRSSKVEGTDDEPVYLDGIVTDITDQKKREAVLRAQREKMKTLYETTERLLTADAPSAVADRIQALLDGVFDYPLLAVSFVEDEQIVPERVSTADGYDLPPIQSLDLEGDSLGARALRSEETVVAHDLQEADNDIPYGDLRSAVCVPIGAQGLINLGRTEPGRFDSFDLNLIDILAKKAATVLARIERERELKAAMQEAEEASRLKSTLLTNMSHEFRTPLTSIIGAADTLQNTLNGIEERYADLIQRGGKRLMNTLDSVLQLSKLEAGLIESTPTSADLVDVIRSTVTSFRAEAEASDVDLQFDPDQPSLPGRWDLDAIRRILSNLLSNALEFTPEGGTVTLGLRGEEDRITLTVTDTGIGISDSFRPRLFDAFTQESEGLDREHEGSGLGLAIVKRMVALLEGRVEVESQKGEGTTVRVHLPRRTTSS